MTETPGRYDVGDRPLRPQPPPSFEAQLKALPPAVRSVACLAGTAGYGRGTAVCGTVPCS
jgi:hypothetical protein